MADRYACGLSGSCSQNPYGAYSHDECRRICIPVERGDLRELAYEALSYDFELILQSSNDDQIAIVQRLTGATIDYEEVEDVIKGLWTQDYAYLNTYGELRPYLKLTLGEFEYLLLRILSGEDRSSIAWDAFVRLIDFELRYLFRGEIDPSLQEEVLLRIYRSARVDKSNYYRLDLIADNWSLFLDRYTT